MAIKVPVSVGEQLTFSKIMMYMVLRALQVILPGIM